MGCLKLVQNHSAVCIFRKVSKTAGSGGGAGDLGRISPLPLLSRFRCVSTPQETLTYIYLQAHHAGPRGRRTSPACGSCRRPLLNNETKGSPADVAESKISRRKRGVSPA